MLLEKQTIKKYWNMVWEMAVADFRLKDQGTALGFLWTLIYPFIYFIVLYYLFVKWMGQHIPDFPLYLIIGIVQWNFFATGTSNAIGIISRYSNYVKSIHFPKAILVLSSVLSILFSHILELIMLLVFWLVVKGEIHWLGVLLVPVLALHIYLIVAISFLLATIGVYFLDIARIWGIFINVGFFLTPIFYTLELINPGKRSIILLNPMTHIIAAVRDVLIGNKLPSIPGLVYVFALSSAILFFGLRTFKKHEGYFAEKV